MHPEWCALRGADVQNCINDDTILRGIHQLIWMVNTPKVSPFSSFGTIFNSFPCYCARLLLSKYFAVLLLKFESMCSKSKNIFVFAKYCSCDGEVRIVRAERGEITTKSEVRKTIFDEKFPTSKVVFLTFEVVFAFFRTKNRGDRQASPFVLQRYNKIERNPNRIFQSYPQVRVVYPPFCNQSAPECLVLH